MALGMIALVALTLPPSRLDRCDADNAFDPDKRSPVGTAVQADAKKIDNNKEKVSGMRKVEG